MVLLKDSFLSFFLGDAQKAQSQEEATIHNTDSTSWN